MVSCAMGTIACCDNTLARLGCFWSLQRVALMRGCVLACVVFLCGVAVWLVVWLAIVCEQANTRNENESMGMWMKTLSIAMSLPLNTHTHAHI